MSAARLSPWLNQWWSVYDFSNPATGSSASRRNFDLIDCDDGKGLEKEFFRNNNYNNSNNDNGEHEITSSLLSFTQSALPMIRGCSSRAEQSSGIVSVFKDSIGLRLHDYLVTARTKVHHI